MLHTLSRMFTCVPIPAYVYTPQHTILYVRTVYTSIIIVRYITACVNLFPTALIPMHNIGNESIVTERDTIII